MGNGRYKLKTRICGNLMDEKWKNWQKTIIEVMGIIFEAIL